MKIQIIGTAFLAAALASCSNEPVTPAGPSATQNGCGNVQGNGNTTYCNTATPTPTPTPGSGAACSKVAPVYQEIVVQAEVGIPPDQSQASYIAAVVTKIRAAGFLVTSGAPIPSDEIALKTSSSALFSETYDVWRADNTPQVLYQQTCRPPIF